MRINLCYATYGGRDEWIFSPLKPLILGCTAKTGAFKIMYVCGYNPNHSFDTQIISKHEFEVNEPVMFV